MIIRNAMVYGFGSLINCEFVGDKNGILNVSKGLISDTDLFFEFVRTMLYGHTLRNGVSTRELYRPREKTDSKGRKVIYGGEMIYDACGRTYRLSCLFGETKNDDISRIVDLVSGRDVKIDLGKTIGEKTLHISEGAFISATRDPGFEASENGDTVSFGSLSLLLGVADGRMTPVSFTDSLKQKLLRITDPKTKKGSLDRLVITKMKMKSSLARTSDRDMKLAKLRKELDRTETELAGIEGKIRETGRSFGLCDAAGTLLTKDRIMASYDQLLGLMRQADLAECEHRRLVKTKLIPKLIMPFLLFALGGFLITMGLTSLSEGPFGWPAEIAGSVLAVIGIVLSVIAFSRHSGRFAIEADGRITTHFDEAVRLRGEISSKTEDLLKLLGDSSCGEIRKKWRESEDIMRSASENERRSAIMKNSGDLEREVAGLKERKKPLVDRIESIHAEIRGLTEFEGVDFPEALFTLSGIDEEIGKLSDEAESLRIAITAAESAERRYYTEVVQPLCSNAAEIYFKTSGEKAEFSIDSQYRITAKCSDQRLALLSLRGAISSFASSETDRQLLFVDPETGAMPFLDKFMRASGIGQLVVVNTIS